MRFILLTVLAALTFNSVADEVQIRKDAPERYTVKKGDTLWDISARFLKSPWKWPEVWQLNREQIKNPHLIYPGDVVVLRNGKLMLERGIQTVKLSPQVRTEPIVGPEAVSSIPYEAVAQFLNHGGIVDAKSMDAAPRILGAKDDRVLFAAGDQVYANTTEPGVAQWEIVRLGKPIVDPDSGEILGNQLEHVGLMRQTAAGSPATFRIERTSQEVADRDRLQPYAGNKPLQYAPHAPDSAFAGKVASTLGGMEAAATYATVVVNKGRNDGLEPGHVLGIYRTGRALDDRWCKKAQKKAFFGRGTKADETDCKAAEGTPSLPEARIGVAFVYRVFDRTAYALVVQSEDAILAKDLVKAP